MVPPTARLLGPPDKFPVLLLYGQSGPFVLLAYAVPPVKLGAGPPRHCPSLARLRSRNATH
jgi:hypothetical protein